MKIGKATPLQPYSDIFSPADDLLTCFNKINEQCCEYDEDCTLYITAEMIENAVYALRRALK